MATKSLKELMAEKAAAKLAATQEAVVATQSEAEELLKDLPPATQAPVVALAVAETAKEQKPAVEISAPTVAHTKVVDEIASLSKVIVHPATAPATPKEDTKDAQAYADILPRIHALAELDDEALANGMKDLKKALMENPAACSLMMPEDMGLMVMALRRMVGEEIVESTKTPKERKAKSKALTAEELAAAFDEL